MSQPDPTAHDWRTAPLLPSLATQPQWGAVEDGKWQPCTLEELITRIRLGPGRVSWNGSFERSPPVFVTQPGSNAIVPATECVELRRALARDTETRLGSIRRVNGWMFYPFAVLTVLMEFGAPAVALLFAIQAVNTGSAHFGAWMKLKHLRADASSYMHRSAEEVRYGAWIAARGASVRISRSTLLVLAWAAVFVAQWAAPVSAQVAHAAFVEAAGLVKPLVAHEPWRLLTYGMLHANVFHIAFNAISMISLGLLIERGAHRHLVVPIWLAGVLVGGLLSSAALTTTSVGASGGILALLGFLVVMSLRRRESLPPGFANSMLQSVLMIAMLGIFAWEVIDNAAHLGGAIAGAAIAAWLFRPQGALLPLNDSRALQFVGRAGDGLFVAILLLTCWLMLRKFV
jgi:membrane associated rhomboid family serine protease